MQKLQLINGGSLTGATYDCILDGLCIMRSFTCERIFWLKFLFFGMDADANWNMIGTWDLEAFCRICIPNNKHIRSWRIAVPVAVPVNNLCSFLAILGHGI